MGSRLHGALAGALLTAGVTFAQDTVKTSPKPHVAEVRFNDGSLVRMTILQDDIDVMTKYGKLTIPLGDIRRIDLGLHLPQGLDQQIDQSIRLLASNAYKERDEATKGLIQAGHLAYPFLKKASASSDLEVTHRVTSLMKRIADKHPPEMLRMKQEDVVHTTEFPVIGRLAAPTIKAHSTHFGNLSLKLADLRTVHLRAAGGVAEFTVDAGKYGSSADQWLDTGVNIDPSIRLVVQCEGQVDLWPSGPGQYMTTPKGYTTAGKGSSYMAGALVGRIGDGGKSFLIGERYDGTPGDEGRLFVHIVPSPWNNSSTGSYRVRVNTDHVALSQR
ncbi:MAG: hypothetical protein L0Y71_04710 [Gemmataceae bacterium]|nr:hypothetical protein [Gemmataceae bacterium]